MHAEELELYNDFDCLAYCKQITTLPFKLNPKSKSKKLIYLYQFDKTQEFKGSAQD